MNKKQKELIRAVPHMACKNQQEFKQRLQWLSEGMLRNHMENVIAYSIDQSEINMYQKFKEVTT